MKKFLIALALVLVAGTSWAQYRPPQRPPAPYPPAYYDLTKSQFTVEPLEGPFVFEACTGRDGTYYGNYVGGTPPSGCPYDGAPSLYNNSYRWTGLDLSKDLFYLFHKNAITDGNADGIDNDGDSFVDESDERYSHEISIESDGSNSGAPFMILRSRRYNLGVGDFNTTMRLDPLNGTTLTQTDSAATPKGQTFTLSALGGNPYAELKSTYGTQSSSFKATSFAPSGAGEVNMTALAPTVGSGNGGIRMWGRTVNSTNGESYMEMSAQDDSGQTSWFRVNAGDSFAYQHYFKMTINGNDSFLFDSTGMKINNETLDEAYPTCDINEAGRINFVEGSGANADTFKICGKNGAGVYSWKDIVTW